MARVAGDRPAAAPKKTKKNAATTKKPVMKKAALLRCVEDNLAETQEIQVELELLVKEREAMCKGNTLLVLHLEVD
ncbi:Aste57867_4083 [Aphanomyces stellatus]|uniref:Aste57867_4083 protein n=1 Tax=Aphanomyces stellatus TaxID=120398 RepID=A0A485KCK1_9STRA|nr:hypothetical protein As57867_004072 [Aphanomyces stellatus]VFT81216.1 Aste57867_4083 [Aphanomyces stellatus]